MFISRPTSQKDQRLQMSTDSRDKPRDQRQRIKLQRYGESLELPFSEKRTRRIS